MKLVNSSVSCENIQIDTKIINAIISTINQWYVIYAFFVGKGQQLNKTTHSKMDMKTTKLFIKLQNQSAKIKITNDNSTNTQISKIPISCTIQMNVSHSNK